jgi:apolipoprotein N-acyltransferase
MRTLVNCCPLSSDKSHGGKKKRGPIFLLEFFDLVYLVFNPNKSTNEIRLFSIRVFLHGMTSVIAMTRWPLFSIRVFLPRRIWIEYCIFLSLDFFNIIFVPFTIVY